MSNVLNRRVKFQVDFYDIDSRIPEPITKWGFIVDEPKVFSGRYPDYSSDFDETFYTIEDDDGVVWHNIWDENVELLGWFKNAE